MVWEVMRVVLVMAFYIASYQTLHTELSARGAARRASDSEAGTDAGTGAVSRERASASPFSSVAKWPTETLRSKSAQRRAISCATLLRSPLPFRRPETDKAAKLSPMSATSRRAAEVHRAKAIKAVADSKKGKQADSPWRTPWDWHQSGAQACAKYYVAFLPS